jgi:undecaprenyl diphosphate synthase
MKQSTSPSGVRPHHTAIILDGNGRWAEARGLPRLAGHRAGAAAVRRTVEAARSLDLPMRTLYAFSSDNWRRPRPEVDALFALLTGYLADEADRLRTHGIRITVIGRRDRLGVAGRRDRGGGSCHGGRSRPAFIAVDYSSREAIARAARRCRRARRHREDLGRILGTPDVDS